MLVVHLFAQVRESAGKDEVSIDSACPMTVSELRLELSRRVPRAARLIARSAVALNGEYAPDAQLIESTDEVALIPPVSGGQME
jgi:molybdopterin converting factor subunit 1